MWCIHLWLLYVIIWVIIRRRFLNNIWVWHKFRMLNSSQVRWNFAYFVYLRQEKQKRGEFDGLRWSSGLVRSLIVSHQGWLMCITFRTNLSKPSPLIFPCLTMFYYAKWPQICYKHIFLNLDQELYLIFIPKEMFKLFCVLLVSKICVIFSCFICVSWISSSLECNSP